MPSHIFISLDAPISLSKITTEMTPTQTQSSMIIEKLKIIAAAAATSEEAQRSQEIILWVLRIVAVKYHPNLNISQLRFKIQLGQALHLIMHASVLVPRSLEDVSPGKMRLVLVLLLEHDDG